MSLPLRQGAIDVNPCAAKALIDGQPVLGRQSKKRRLVIQQTLLDERRDRVPHGVRAIEELQEVLAPTVEIAVERRVTH